MGSPGHYAAITGPDYQAGTKWNNRMTPQDFRTADEAEKFILEFILKKDIDSLDS